MARSWKQPRPQGPVNAWGDRPLLSDRLNEKAAAKAGPAVAKPRAEVRPEQGAAQAAAGSGKGGGGWQLDALQQARQQEAGGTEPGGPGVLSVEAAQATAKANKLQRAADTAVAALRGKASETKQLR